MNNKGVSKIIFLLIVFIVLALIFLGWFLFRTYTDSRIARSLPEDGENVLNPVANLSIEEAASKFDDSYIFYLLRIIGASKLHSSLAYGNPKIELHLEQMKYNVELSDNKIVLNNGEINNEDIIIRTNKVEIIKMLKDKGYVISSFNSGKSSIELVAGNIELYSKGYLDLYNNLQE